MEKPCESSLHVFVLILFNSQLKCAQVHLVKSIQSLWQMFKNVSYQYKRLCFYIPEKRKKFSKAAQQFFIFYLHTVYILCVKYALFKTQSGVLEQLLHRMVGQLYVSVKIINFRFPQWPKDLRWRLNQNIPSLSPAMDVCCMLFPHLSQHFLYSPYC